MRNAKSIFIKLRQIHENIGKRGKSERRDKFESIRKTIIYVNYDARDIVRCHMSITSASA